MYEDVLCVEILGSPCFPWYAARLPPIPTRITTASQMDLTTLSLKMVNGSY